jgi:hypothetical protein
VTIAPTRATSARATSIRRTSPRAARDVLTTVAEEFDRIYAALDPLAAEFAGLIGAIAPATRETMASLRPTIFGVLARHRDLIAGAGVFTVPDLLADARHWLEWWWTRNSGTPEALRVNLDPAAPDFFDYTTDDWYATPMSTSAPHVSGPYVDYACTNQYALTVTVPVKSGRELVGIAAADVLVSSLEARILPALRGLAEPMVLVNASGRVVTSSSSDFAPGIRYALDSDEPLTSPQTRERVQGSHVSGWQLISVS